jgi:type I restriction enzyme M protein
MPLTPAMRQNIGQIRNYLWGGGYPDPLSNAEQLSYLFFFYLIEHIDEDNKLRAEGTGRAYESLFAGEWTLQNPLHAPAKGVETVPKERMRWSFWARGLSGENLVRFVRDEVFAFYTEVAGQAAMNFMARARLGIDDPTVLTQVVGLIDQLRLDEADADSKGAICSNTS